MEALGCMPNIYAPLGTVPNAEQQDRFMKASGCRPNICAIESYAK